MDKFTAFEIVVDRYGREHKVYPAKIAWKDEIRRLTPKFNDSAVMLNILLPQYDQEGEIEYDGNGEVVYDDTAYNAMMEIFIMAFDNKYTKEQIEQFMDSAIATRVFEVFYNLSGLKKKMIMQE